MPQHAAVKAILAPVADVWAFIAEPYNIGDWWPGIGGVEPDRRGLAPGARWKIRGSDTLPGRSFFGPGMFKRPGAAGTLLVMDVARERRLAFELIDESIGAQIDLEPLGENRTQVTITVDAPWGAVRRSYAQRALGRLYDLVQTGAEAE
jgi:uncharacterized protein YndB with AHSA1/START domain